MIWFRSEMMECFPSRADSCLDKGGGPPTLLSAYSHSGEGYLGHLLESPGRFPRWVGITGDGLALGSTG